jgi:formylglycine-generating enzyme required for sulfatase activity
VFPSSQSTARILTLTACCLTAWAQETQAPAPCLQRPAAERPYPKDRLLAVVRDQTASRAEFLIRTCGASVVWSDGLLAELKAANANDKVIQAVHDVAAKAAVPPKIVVPPPPSGPKPGELRVNPKDGLTYAFIPPGSFEMGCRAGQSNCEHDEGPPHKVRLTKGFWMGQTEVTVGAYKKYVAAAGIKMPPEPKVGAKSFNPSWATDDLPISMVTWMDSQSYCQWANLRLPTEAEWEYAARGPGAGGEPADLTAVAWFADDSGLGPLDSEALRKKDPRTFIGHLLDNGNGPHEAGKKNANGWKLHDMLGNVWEWTSDWYKENAYDSAQEVDPTGPDSGFHRVLRGGSWLNLPSYVRVSRRLKGIPDQRIFANGFRCAGTTLK